MAIATPSTSSGRRSRRAAMSDINVTPLVDVVLVLLIIFMVTAPMMQRGVDVKLPRVESAADAKDQMLVVTVGKDQRVYLNDQIVAASLLGEKVRDLSRSTGVDFVFLRADREVPYGRVMTVMDSIKRAGIEKVGLVTEPGPAPRNSR